MRRAKLSTKFLVPAVMALAVLAAGVSFATILIVQGIVKQMVADYVVEYVRHQTDQHRVSTSDFSGANPTGSRKVFNDVANDIAIRGIHRTTVWDATGKIIFTDNPKLIGYRNVSDPLIAKALTGAPQTAIRKPIDGTDRADLGDTNFLEVLMSYTPSDANQPTGVLQIYFELDTLNGHLKAALTGIIIAAISLVIIIALTIAGLLQVVIIRPVQKLEKATRRLAAGHIEAKSLDVNSRDEIGDLARSFEKMSGNLKRLENLRNEFFFVATHELRAPVTVLRGYLALLRDHPADLKEYLPDLIDANNRLAELVNGLLDIARTETGKIQINSEPVDAGKLLITAVTGFRAAAKEQSISIQYLPPVKSAVITADAKRFQEVLENLLSNAIKYGKPGGHIFTSVSQVGDTVSLSIRDDGIGISVADQKHLFQKFYRASNAVATGIVGTGLGLYIVKELVTRMGGKIDFKSVIGEGTSINITFSKRKDVAAKAKTA